MLGVCQTRALHQIDILHLCQIAGVPKPIICTIRFHRELNSGVRHCHSAQLTKDLTHSDVLQRVSRHGTRQPVGSGRAVGWPERLRGRAVVPESLKTFCLIIRHSSLLPSHSSPPSIQHPLSSIHHQAPCQTYLQRRYFSSSFENVLSQSLLSPCFCLS